MKPEDTLIEFTVVPIGSTETDSISPIVAKVVKQIKKCGLPSEIHAMGTVVEGNLDECLDLVKTCVREALEDSPRISASVRLDVRPGHSGRIEGNVRSVEQKWREERLAG